MFSKIKRIILSDFPHSQHHPVVVNWVLEIPVVRMMQKPCWNFNKANWGKFANYLDLLIKWNLPDIEVFDRFTKAIVVAAKKNLLRGLRKDYLNHEVPIFHSLHNRFINMNAFNLP
ncbi:Hypothetical protein CINCED_3A002511 [Cinara cedri]|uniref:Uncharacterized protein n=1 Tax=Cinara cedri TaxID=506608 RepID=A0A5E4MS60_9HEMI|nr:Hypothetical protein CINCED_3A002511 [Cinara cedri]